MYDKGKSRFGGGNSGGRNRKFGGGGGFGGGGFGARGSRGPTTMHQATCSECSKSCEVPFKPNGSKPVFCNSCFKKGGNDFDGGRPEGGRDFVKRSDYGNRDKDFDKQMHKTTCSECGKSCEVPFKPSNGKLIYCKDCFGKVQKRDAKHDTHGKGSDKSKEFNEKFEILNIKLDRILKFLDIKTPAAAKLSDSENSDEPPAKTPVIKAIKILKKSKTKAKK